MKASGSNIGINLSFVKATDKSIVCAYKKKTKVLSPILRGRSNIPIPLETGRHLNLYMLGNFSCFCCRLLIFFQFFFFLFCFVLFKISFRNAIRMSNGLDLDQDRRS